jgi:hypothetical protein
MSVLPSLFHYLPVNDSAWRCLAQLIETARGEELPGALDTSRGMEEVSDPLVAEACPSQKSPSGNCTSRPDTRRIGWRGRKWPQRGIDSLANQAVPPSHPDR